MKIQFLDKNAKLAAIALPVSMAKKELDEVAKIISGCIRLARGKNGNIAQVVNNKLFRVSVEQIAPYPFVIAEDKEDAPFIPLIEDTTDPIIMWAMQSAQNMKWLIDYAAELAKKHGLKINEHVTEAFEATEFEFEYKAKTPPPVNGVRRQCISVSVEESYRKNLHYIKEPKFLIGDKPNWFDTELNVKLVSMNKKGGK